MNITLTNSTLKQDHKDLGITWFKAYLNREGCLAKKVFCFRTNIIAN